ncbi:MAG: ATPase domain-containing protein [Candidatus Thorarchaeota archaeon]|jgi:KaiC/GvpD/RAD55 family RecA-like ATPase
MTRAKTGIKGFDDLIEGGIIEGNTVLVSGKTGSGKTIFGLQFLYNGATKYDEPGIFVTLETRPNELRSEAMQFGWNLRNLEEEGAITIIDAASGKAQLPTSEKYALRRGFDMTTLAEEIYRAIDETKAKRLVIDCISGLGISSNEPSHIRNELFKISALLSELKVTSLLLGEIVEPDSQSRAGVEQFVTQGLITLNLSEVNGILKRDLLIWKMKQTHHSMKKHPFTIGKSGIEISPKKKSSKKST